MDERLCPQCNEPTSRAGGSGKSYCNLCGWVDLATKKPSASERTLQQQREKKQKKEALQKQREERQQQREALQKQREESIAQSLSNVGRFPILNILVIVFYINAFLIFIFTLLVIGSDQASNLHSDARTVISFGILMIGLFSIVLNIAISEVLRLGLSIESHLYDIREKSNR